MPNNDAKHKPLYGRLNCRHRPKASLRYGQPDSKGDRAFIAGVIAPTAAEEGEKEQQQQQCWVLLFTNGKFMLRRQQVNGAAGDEPVLELLGRRG